VVNLIVLTKMVPEAPYISGGFFSDSPESLSEDRDNGLAAQPLPLRWGGMKWEPKKGNEHPKSKNPHLKRGVSILNMKL